MNRKTRIVAPAGAILAVLLTRPALAEVTLGEEGGWKVTTDGRVNAFISVAKGTGIPDGQPDFAGTITKDTKDTAGDISSTRVRNGFMMSILGMTLRKEISPDFKVSARVGLWMNTSSSRTKNTPGLVDPRELYGKIEGSWGSFEGGSNMALFGRGGILVDYRIAHNYGMGYPCLIQDASGGACGMVAFGAVFPGFEPGLIYATPNLGGFGLSVGLYDPANIGLGDLNRAPLPRFEAEAKFDLEETFHVFASGFWQTMQGTVPDPTGMAGAKKDIKADAWGAQAGLMLALGPVMVGGAAFTGAGISPITHIDEHQTAVDASGKLRKSRGVFGLGAFTFENIHLKLAGGAGIFHVDKTCCDPKNDPQDPVNPTTGAPQNPQVMKQNLGFTVGLYETVAPVTFALEYFRAQHTLYDFGEANATNPALVDIKRPQQAVNFVNAGFTVIW